MICCCDLLYHVRQGLEGELLSSQISKLMSPSRGRIATYIHSACGPLSPKLFILRFDKEGVLVVESPSSTIRSHLWLLKSFRFQVWKQQVSHPADVIYRAVRTGSCWVYACVKALFPVNLSSRLRVAFGLPDGEGLLLLAHLLQPLLLQEQHQGVPHVHHLDQLLEDPLLLCLLLGGLVCETNKYVVMFL